MDEQITAENILNSINDGIYVTTPERKIVYWNSTAESITGWSAKDVVGSHCYDDILCHEDKEGHKLCSEEYCPLHRSISTNVTSDTPLTVFARTKDGHTIPLQVTTGPIHDSKGNVIGGVEAFRDIREQQKELIHAQHIQRETLRFEMPDDSRITFRYYSKPLEMIGGDFYRVIVIDENRYGLFLADVMGHGIPSALYTMYLRTLFDRHSDLLIHPAKFLESINNELNGLLGDDFSFAACTAGVIDLESGEFRYCSAGIPAFVHKSSRGDLSVVKQSGLPLGIVADGVYSEENVSLCNGESILLFTDGALELFDKENVILGESGLLNILRENNYSNNLPLSEIEQLLLHYSNSVQLPDDLTLLEIAIPSL